MQYQLTRNLELYFQILGMNLTLNILEISICGLQIYCNFDNLQIIVINYPWIHARSYRVQHWYNTGKFGVVKKKNLKYRILTSLHEPIKVT